MPLLSAFHCFQLSVWGPRHLPLLLAFHCFQLSVWCINIITEWGMGVTMAGVGNNGPLASLLVSIPCCGEAASLATTWAPTAPGT